jgi:tRNA threonylcarbamoyl adenosine modification protein (Sua5/YciO/YrdC/YwlC family)
MVRIITKEELEKDKALIHKLKKSVFIYPTDTIYGIGCNATDKNLVQKIRDLKNNQNRPFSIIIPKKEDIETYCNISKKNLQWLDKLPGRYTFILDVKEDFFSENVNLGSGTIGIRYPDNWFTKIVEKMKVPIITTSANKSGENFMTSIEGLDNDIKMHVDFIIDDGEIDGQPSTIIDLTKEEPDIIRK